MDFFDLSNKLNFDEIDLTAPNIVVEKLVAQIEMVTKGIVKGTVKSYSGHIVSYRKPVLSGLQAVINGLDQEVDVQGSLGKIGDTASKFEFYLSTPAFEQYKFRICFFQFGVANYPVTVVMEQGIADCINNLPNSDYIISCINPKELEDLIVNIMYSKHIIHIMQELIHINQIYHNRNEELGMIEEDKKNGISNEDENTD